MLFINRLLQLPLEHSLFLFGARGVGKSSLLEENFNAANSLFINLLDPLEQDRFELHPNELIELIEALPDNKQYVIVDEIQKVPKLLDVIHLLIETRKSKKIFILTGSSARKLKMAGVNLLAGRAFVYHLYPFSFMEVIENFDLESALQYGMLPKVFALNTDQSKLKFLQTYAQVYLKEEIWGEHLIRKLGPFRRFLEVAAQCNGKIINYSNISRDVGVDDKTVKNYFSIVEDTLLGIILEPYVSSFRKRLKLSPKFYFIDVGIARSLARTLTQKPQRSTSYYGELFEQFVIIESIKVASYFKSEYRFSYLMTESNVEIDLIVERPGEKLLCIEIKSSNAVTKQDLTSLKRISNDLENCEAVCFSQDPRPKKIENMMVYPWMEGIKKFFWALDGG